MGNDLMFQKAKVGRRYQFPCEWGGIEIETDGFPRGHLVEILTAMGASTDPSGRYQVDLADNGHLYVDLSEDSAFVDMHVKPSVILEIFEALVARDSYVVLFEMGDGHFHDPASYKEFVRQNY